LSDIEHPFVFHCVSVTDLGFLIKMCSTSLLFSAATVVSLVAQFGECATQRSGSLRTSLHYGRESHHDVREEHPSHDDLSSRMGAMPSDNQLDTHARGYAQHLGHVTRHKHASAAAAQDGQVKSGIRDASAEVSSPPSDRVGDDSAADAALDSQTAAEFSVGDDGLEFDETGLTTTGDEADGDSDTSVDAVDDVGGGGDSSATGSSDSTGRDSASARLYREAGASRLGQPAVVAPVPIDNITTTTTTTTRAPMVSTTASVVTGLPGQLPGNDGEITTPEPTSPSSAPESIGEITTPAPVPEGADAPTVEPGPAPQDVGADDAETGDQTAAGNATSVVGNSTASENSSTVGEDQRQEYGDAAEAHDDGVVGGGRTASSTVSAGEGQGSGSSALVVGFIIILSLIAVALALGARL